MFLNITRQEVLLVATLLLCSIAATALLACRVVHTGTTALGFLVWNLFLAWIPLGTALLVNVLHRNERLTRTRAVVLGTLWIAFFPNAPYIITDFVHLRPRPEAPIWFDILVIMSFAWTGLMIGFVSLHWMQRLIRLRIGTIASSVAALCLLGLSGFGIYLGRFGRFNSWDLLTNPLHVAFEIVDRIVDPFSHVRTLAVTLLYGSFLILAYLTLLVFTQAHGAVAVNFEGRKTRCLPQTT